MSADRKDKSLPLIHTDDTDRKTYHGRHGDTEEIGDRKKKEVLPLIHTDDTDRKKQI
jgi:hypothetical protein